MFLSLIDLNLGSTLDFLFLSTRTYIRTAFRSSLPSELMKTESLVSTFEYEVR